MKVKDYILSCIDDIQVLINNKYFELEQLENSLNSKEKEIYLLELKRDVYKNYLENGRRFKNGTN